MARGWFGNKEAHSRAAKKGWATRRAKQKQKNTQSDYEQRKAVYRQKSNAAYEARKAANVFTLSAEDHRKADTAKKAKEEREASERKQSRINHLEYELGRYYRHTKAENNAMRKELEKLRASK